MNSIGTKLLFFIVGLVSLFSSFLLYRTYLVSNEYVLDIVKQQANLALQFNLSIRKYVAEKIRPVMYELLGEGDFVPETMSTSFVSRSIFEDVQKNFPDFVLKFSSDNPRNPSNQAGPEELKIIEFFNNNPEQKTWFGDIEIDGKLYFGKFYARRMEKSCTLCHGAPVDAPKSLVERYGSKAGFHRPIGEVIAMDTVAIPTSKIREYLASELKKNLTIIVFSLLLLVLSLFVLIKIQIINRVKNITKLFSDAASSKDFSRLPLITQMSRDEIGVLANSYNTLAGELEKYHKDLDEEIKARIAIEEKLIQSNNTLESVLNSSIPICITNLDYELIRVNEAYHELWPDESSGTKPQKCYEVTPGPNCHKYSCPLRQIVAGKEIYVYEAKKKVKGLAQDSDFIINARPFRDLNGKLLGIVESFQDITAWKKAEEEKDKLQMQLRQAQKLESIGTLAGGIAHDFNNILTGILGYAELGTLRADKESSLAPYFQEIKKAGDRAKDLVKHILTFSRQSEQKKKPVQIHLIVQEVLQLLRSSAPKKIELVENIDKECGYIFADITQIHQVVMNLCTNAVHAMGKDKGALTVTLETVYLNEDDLTDKPGLGPGNFISLTVQDTGHGISHEIMGRIFDPYFTTKGVDKGTGLGLAVTHGIVQTHGGIITVESKVGSGSTFKVFLPVVKPEKVPVNMDEKILPTGQEMVLLVDDETTVANLMRQFLESLGYKVSVRTSSIEAYEAFRNDPNRFDLVITDQKMPNMSGIELARELLLIRADIPIILCTGFSNNVDQSMAASLGIKGFLMKPVSVADLANLIRKVLDSP